MLTRIIYRGKQQCFVMQAKFKFFGAPNFSTMYFEIKLNKKRSIPDESERRRQFQDLPWPCAAVQRKKLH